MSDIRERLLTHRSDALALLEQASRTAQLYSGFRLAGAVSHLARAQVLLAEELDHFAGGAEEKEQVHAEDRKDPASASDDDTAVDGLRRKP